MAICLRIVRQIRIRLFIGLLVLASIGCIDGLGTNAADAYVLEGPHVLELMARKLSGVSTMRVHQQVIVDDPAISAEPVVLDETLSYLFPTQFRSEIIHQNSQRIHVVSHGQALTIVDNKITADTQRRSDWYKDLLLYNSARLLHKMLATAGVDVGISSLGRRGDRIVYVIGANYPDESVSQVWVDKDQLLPLRWLIVRKAPGSTDAADRWEFVYTDWQKVDGVSYPFGIETIHNDQRIRRIRVTKVDANAVIDKELVNISQLQSTYPSAEVPAPLEHQPDPGIDEVQRTIEDFKKKFEP
jgi:outer membrane lipoprotein-sorting protein